MNVYLTNEESKMIKSWISKTTPEQIHGSFNVDLYLKIKKIRNARNNGK